MDEEIKDFKKKTEDTLTVMEAFQRKHEQAMLEHKEWLQSHDQAFARHQEAMAEADLRMVEIDEKINILIRTQQELAEDQRATQKSLKEFLDSMRGGNGQKN